MGLKFNCSNAACRARLEVEDALAGLEVPCPQCGTVLLVPESHDIRFTCHTKGCGQHLVVDVSEAGRFVKCPACGKPQRIPGDPPKPIGGEPPVPLRSGGVESGDQGRQPAASGGRLSWGSRLGAVQPVLARWFFGAVLVGLVLAGVAKISSWGFKPWYPDGRDAVLGLPLNRVLPVLGVLECLTAVGCAWAGKIRVAGMILIWFALNWWVWRVGQWAMQEFQAIPALGRWGGELGIRPVLADRGMMFFTLLMALGSGWFVVWEYRQAASKKGEAHAE